MMKFDAYNRRTPLCSCALTAFVQRSYSDLFAICLSARVALTGMTWNTSDAEISCRRLGRMGEKTRGNQASTRQERGGVFGSQEPCAGLNLSRLFAVDDLGAFARQGTDLLSVRNLLETCTSAHQKPTPCSRWQSTVTTRSAKSICC